MPIAFLLKINYSNSFYQLALFKGSMITIMILNKSQLFFIILYFLNWKKKFKDNLKNKKYWINLENLILRNKIKQYKTF